MAETRRRLTAILAADVAGYSRLLAEDEGGTLDALRKLRRELFEPAVSEHRGKVAKRMGDGWLVQFEAVADAVRCAMAIQDAMIERSNIRLRMGAHLGDVTHEDEDIYGDGINIAARLQTLAEPGDLLLSDDCARQLDAQATSALHDLGTQSLKNIDKPVRAWRYRPGAAPTPSAATSLPCPTLLVSPLQGAGAAADFASGLDVELATALGHIRWIRVGEATGARPTYELSGAVRAAGERVRVSYRLTDRATGEQLLSRQVDGDTADVFLAQELISNEISNVVEHTILQDERQRLRGPADAWHAFVTGFAALASGDAARIDTAIAHLEQATAGNAVMPRALSLLASGCIYKGHLLDHANAAAHYAAGLTHAARCLELDPDDPTALAIGLFGCQMQGRVQDSRIKATQLLRVAPSYPLSLAAVGTVRLWDHAYGDALALFDRAIACGRKGQFYPWFLQWRAAALYLLADHAGAEATARECVLDFPNFSGGYRYLGMALALLGRIEEARAALTTAHRLGTATATQTANFVPDDIQGRFDDALRKAGMETLLA